MADEIRMVQDFERATAIRGMTVEILSRKRLSTLDPAGARAVAIDLYEAGYRMTEPVTHEVPD